MADNSTMPVKTIENHRVLTMTNELQIDGHHLIEKKQIHTNVSNKFVVESSERVHIRSIDGKSYKVTEIICHSHKCCCPVVETETDMTEDEVKKFKEDWKNLWNPNITKNELNFSLDI